MTARTGFHKKFKFRVEEGGLTVAAFNKCSELSVEVEKVEYREGGCLIPDKSPGLLTFTDITLERGIVVTAELYDWFIQVANAETNTGLQESVIRRTLDIVQLDRENNPLRRWRVFNAWAQKFVAADGWDNEASENVIESLTLTYDYFKLIAL